MEVPHMKKPAGTLPRVNMQCLFCFVLFIQHFTAAVISICADMMSSVDFTSIGFNRQGRI